jgi:hypothetical protein
MRSNYGEAHQGDDDVEGHSHRGQHPKATGDDDVEGHIIWSGKRGE